MHPRMVSPRLPQAVSRDLAGDTKLFDGIMDDPPCLNPANRSFLLSSVAEYIFALSTGKIKLQGIYGILAESNLLIFPGFLFRHADVASEFPGLEIVDIVPAELQQVTDSECRTGAEDDHDMIAVLPLLQKETGKVVQVGLFTDWF